MITKGTEEYGKASKLANKIQGLASYERWNNNSYFPIAFEELGKIIFEVEKIGGFASEVAKTIDKTMNPYGFKVAYVSSKQAWIIACSVIENNLNIELN